MKKALLVLALLLALGGGYLATSRLLRPALPAETVGTEAKMDWLAREFALGPAAQAEVKRLQLAYAPICEQHCAAIAEAQDALQTAVAAGNAADRAAAEAELARLEVVCAEATRAHLRSVAAQMHADQAARFLAMMEPRVAHTSHRHGAPDFAPPAKTSDAR